jgi:hypothetical protein
MDAKDGGPRSLLAPERAVAFDTPKSRREKPWTPVRLTSIRRDVSPHVKKTILLSPPFLGELFASA